MHHKAYEIHQGRNVKSFREMLGMKQEALALELGQEWNQKRVSLLEAKELIEPELLTEVAKALKVPEEAIKNFDEEAVFNIIGNTVTNHDQAAFFNYYPTFNPIDKLLKYTKRTNACMCACFKANEKKWSF